MSVTTIDKTFYVETGNRLSNISYLKLFNMLQDADGTKYLNLMRLVKKNGGITFLIITMKRRASGGLLL
jgi:hypothetical protein